MSQVNPNIGSGTHSYRNQNQGKTRGVIPLVAIANWEDDSSANPFRTSNYSIPSGVSIKVPTINLEFRRSIGIANIGAWPIYIGGTSGTVTSSGFPLGTGEKVSFGFGALIDLFIQASGGDSAVRVLEIS